MGMRWRGWNRVEPAFVPGMAAAHAAQSQHTPARGAMAAQGLDRVMRAGRVETAILAEHGRQHQLVRAQDEDQDCFHGATGVGATGAGAGFPANLDWEANRRVNSTRSSALSAAVVAGPVLALTAFARRTT